MSRKSPIEASEEDFIILWLGKICYSDILFYNVRGDVGDAFEVEK